MKRTIEELNALREQRKQVNVAKRQQERKRAAGRVKRLKITGGELLDGLELTDIELRWLADPANRAMLARLIKTGRSGAKSDFPPTMVQNEPERMEAAE